MHVVAVNILGPSSPKAISTSVFKVTIHIVDREMVEAEKELTDKMAL